MEDQKFLLWVADRLIYVYGENPATDFVTKLRAVAKATPPDRVTPNTGKPLSTDEDFIA